MGRKRIASHPLVAAALAGAAAGLVLAALLLRSGDAAGMGTFTRSDGIFAAAALPARWWMGMMFGWVWRGSRASELLVMLALNGVVWTVALTALVRGLRRSARARWIAVESALAGTALAVLLWIVRLPELGPYDGARGLIVLAQLPGMALLTLNGYDTYLWDGTMTDGRYRPGPVTLLWLSIANALLVAATVRVARFTWRWMRTPLPRRRPVAEG
ncbi:MAG TPA: hypothetical protein VEQ60_31650 [Longimicrobium sp.]|nr:hypothetical protein [Longimicrobium sp.]